MGSFISNIQHRIISTEDTIPIPPMRELTTDQVDIIKTTWTIPAAKPLDSGEKILYSYFERYPHNQLKFAAFHNHPLVMLKGTPGFRSHANKIMGTIGIAIDCLGKPGGLDVIVSTLNDMGRSHRRRGISKKAFTELRVILLEVLMEVCHLDEEGEVAWNYLLDIIFHVVFTNLDEKKIF